MKLDEDIFRKLWYLDWTESNGFILILGFYALFHYILGIVFMAGLHFVAQNIFDNNFFDLGNHINSAFGLLVTIYFGIIFRCILQFLNKKFGKKDYLK